jgi:hypothetical protein
VQAFIRNFLPTQQQHLQLAQAANNGGSITESGGNGSSPGTNSNTSGSNTNGSTGQ